MVKCMHMCVCMDSSSCVYTPLQEFGNWLNKDNCILNYMNIIYSYMWDSVTEN